MKHSYKVVLCFVLACILALAASFLGEFSAVSNAPFFSHVDQAVASFGLFAFLFLLFFDVLVVLVEGADKR